MKQPPDLLAAEESRDRPYHPPSAVLSRLVRRPGVTVVAVAAVLLTAATTGSVVWASGGHNSGQSGADVRVATTPAPPPAAAISGLGSDGLLPWSSPLVITAVNGTIQSVESTDPTAEPVSGTIRPDGTWSSTVALFPATTYQLDATVLDTAGDAHVLPVTATTTEAKDVLTAKLTPGDHKVVGVGQPIAVRLDRKVTSRSDRAAVERHLTVTTTPSVQGSWRWMSATELHYRPASFWASGTQVQVKAALQGVPLSGGIWGRGTTSSTFTIGDDLTSVVDIAAHTMTVSQNGTVLRTLKASMGKPGFDTRGGTFLVLEKYADHVMDSETQSLPAGTPGYKTPVKWAVRITNSGTFTHGAPWSVPSQGVANVSHGCINLAPPDAEWYFNLAKRGDVVKIVNAVQPPLTYDAGSQDWNMSYAEWEKGSALA
ncbi:MAG: ErfK/YbiS/YcfS/YnhG [Frankiales bacterium]|nr:ErfK/YbiS/YcfS/YnhG [Frankiales bacterium]